MKNRVPWLSVVLELWEGLCPPVSFLGRSDSSGAAAPAPGTAAPDSSVLGRHWDFILWLSLHTVWF